MLLSINCFAKINLFLQINNKRLDGYHNLQSLFTIINLYDVLHIKKSPEFSFNIIGNYSQQLLADQHNIINKIWQYFVTNFCLDSDLEIILDKNIPIGAGLGGGSSNGAGFILALNKIFSLNLSLMQLLEISLKFGSDLPFFLVGKPALVFGRGEKVVPLNKNLPKLPILLIHPKINLSTATVFTTKINFSKPFDFNYLQNLDLINLLSIGNNLENSAISLVPEIGQILTDLHKFQPLVARMSGSGSSCFAIFANSNDCNVGYDWFCKNFPHYFVKIV
jgi:4-diphosphocytidyl-2-C-methyl-D-erythritol kinase